MPPIISFIGRSNSGKTTLIEKLIKHFTSQNMHIGLIKHTLHEFSFDKKGKDSYRHREAGAETVIVTNNKKIGMISDLAESLSPLQIAEKYMSQNIDLIIIEGYKVEETLKIEVAGDQSSPPLFLSGIEGVRAIVTDNEIETDLPCFKRNDIEQIAFFIKKILNI